MLSSKLGSEAAHSIANTKVDFETRTKVKTDMPFINCLNEIVFCLVVFSFFFCGSHQITIGLAVLLPEPCGRLRSIHHRIRHLRHSLRYIKLHHKFDSIFNYAQCFWTVIAQRLRTHLTACVDTPNHTRPDQTTRLTRETAHTFQSNRQSRKLHVRLNDGEKKPRDFLIEMNTTKPHSDRPECGGSDMGPICNSSRL